MNTEQPFDLNAYLDRIGHSGPIAPTLETLRELHRAHICAIPFENLDPLLGRDVRLDLESLQRKLVGSPRGGYCFEHNLLFGRALAGLGFQVSGLAARVLWGQPEDAITARSHMLLRIELPEGTFIADVGFGGQSPTGPLRLAVGVEQQTPLELFRLMPIGDDLKLQVKVGEEWSTLYRFDLQRQLPIDYEAANYYLSTSPASHFTARLFVARPNSEGRQALLNNRLNHHRIGHPSETRMLASAAEMRTALRQVFGVEVPDAEGFDAAIARLKLFSAP